MNRFDGFNVDELTLMFKCMYCGDTPYSYPPIAQEIARKLLSLGVGDADLRRNCIRITLPKIEAIKAIRDLAESYGVSCSLKGAKELVDSWS